MSFKLRIASATDVDELHAIYMDKEVNPFLNFEIMSKESFKPIFNELLQSGDLYIYENDTQIVATCVVMRLKRRAQHVVTLGTLATHPDFQGKGIGTQFIKELINKLKATGIKRIDLCAEADNPKAISFYQKLGFKLEGVLQKYFLRENEDKYIDEHLMAMILD
ncbi:MAG: GNAT family N-acetyltransferase [Gammaproteobacteria bacterium]|nr:GNAT family N-acetyltransferase [Gammaproteobacteria bacterium]